MSSRKRGVKVQATDLETGDTEEAIVPTGDYLIIAVEPATYEVQVYPNGTHVIVRVPNRLESCVSASDCGSEGYGFKPRRPPHFTRESRRQHATAGDPKRIVGSPIGSPR